MIISFATEQNMNAARNQVYNMNKADKQNGHLVYWTDVQIKLCHKWGLHNHLVHNCKEAERK